MRIILFLWAVMSPFTSQLWLINFAKTKNKKWSPGVHVLTRCDVAHEGNRKTMKINLRMKQMV